MDRELIKSKSSDVEVKDNFYDNIKYFECKSCGCVYYYNSVSDNSLINSMYCPSCGERIVW